MLPISTKVVMFLPCCRIYFIYLFFLFFFFLFCVVTERQNRGPQSGLKTFPASLFFLHKPQQFHSLSCGGQFWYGVLMTVMASQAKYSRGTMIDCNSIVIRSYIFAVQSLSRSRMLLILCWWDDESPIWCFVTIAF